MAAGERIREEREKRGWTQGDLSKHSGTNRDTISGVESGRHRPRPSTLRKIAGAFGLEVRDLFEEATSSPKALPNTEPLLSVPSGAFEERVREAANQPRGEDAQRALEILVEQIKEERNDYLATENSDFTRLLHRAGHIMSLLKAARRREFWEQIKDLDEATLEEIYRDTEDQRTEALYQLEQAKERFEEGELTPSEMGGFYQRADDITSRSWLLALRFHNLKHPEHRDQTEQEAEKILVGAANQ